MAKTVYTHNVDGKGNVTAVRVQKANAAAGAIPWTKAPTTVAGKLKRAWIG